MMGRSHAASGWCTGLAVAPALGIPTWPTLVFAATVAGWALVPDLDCSGATASRVLGPLTGALSWLLRAASRHVHAWTRSPQDHSSGEHRHLSHTVLFAAGLGLLVWSAALTGAGRWVTLGVLAFGVLLAQAALGDWIALVAIAGGLALSLHGFTEALDATRPWLWIAVTLGCIVHCLGDSLTLSGCPFLFPLRIAGETWYELRPPILRIRLFRWLVVIPLRFRTGGQFESAVVFPVLGVLGVLLIPGVWGLALSITHHT